MENKKLLTIVEREEHIKNLREILDFSLSYQPENNIRVAYATGGTVRRLYMLENNIPMHINDFNAMYKSDIDLHSSQIQNSSRLKSPFNANVAFFDGFGLQDMKLKNANKKFSAYPDMTLQYINIDFSKDEYERLCEETIDQLRLPYDIDSSKFLYFNGKVYNKREFEVPNNFFIDHITIEEKTEFRSISRIMKFESYGFLYSIDNIKDFINAAKANKGATIYGQHNISLSGPCFRSASLPF